MNSRITARFCFLTGKSKQSLFSRVIAAALLPLVTVSFLSPALLPSAMAIGPEPGDIGLPGNATPEQVLDRLCDQLRTHPDQAIDMAKWSISYFDSQIRTTPAFASALAIIFADCLAQSEVSSGLKAVAAGPVDPIAEIIAQALTTLWVATIDLPYEARLNMIIAAVAVLDPPLAAMVLELLGKAIGVPLGEGGAFGNSAPPVGGQGNIISALPTPTPPVTPDVNN